MSPLLKAILLALVLATPGLGVGYVYYNAAVSPDDWVYAGKGQWKDGGLHAAPAPLAGAGLPILVVLGGGYWIARRLRRNAN